MSAPARPTRPGVDESRPFGAHLRMSWWKPLVLIVALPPVLVGLQVVFFLLAGLVEGSDDPLSTVFTPWKSLAANLSIGVTGLLAAGLLVWMTGVPWRSLLRHRRAFDRRRLAHYLIGASIVMGTALTITGLVAPESTGWTGFGITGTTVALLAVTVLTSPIQAVGEELTYRSALLPAAASWVRAVRPALAVGLVVSGLGFAVAHGSGDPWLFGYFLVIAVNTGLIAIISGGMEAPMAFHVANNVLAGIAANVLSGGGSATIDRTTDTGGPALSILIAGNIAMVVLVRIYERRARTTRPPRPTTTRPDHRPTPTRSTR